MRPTQAYPMAFFRVRIPGDRGRVETKPIIYFARTHLGSDTEVSRVSGVRIEPQGLANLCFP